MTYEEQVRHYADVRRRLYNPPTRVPDSLSAPVCRDVKVEKEDPDTETTKREQRRKKQRTTRIKNPTSPKAKRRLRNLKLDSQFRVRHKLLVPNPCGQKWIEIVNRVTMETGVTLADMRTRSPIQRIARAAARAMYLMQEEIEVATLPWIAEKLGRDHTTILVAIRRYKERNGL